MKSVPVAADTSLFILATLGGSAGAKLTISAPTPNAILLSPSSVAGGTAAKATVVLTGPAPAPGQNVPLASGGPEATVPATVVVAAGTDRRKSRHAWRFRELVASQLQREIDRVVSVSEFDRIVDAVAAREIDPYSAAARIVDRIRGI